MESDNWYVIQTISTQEISVRKNFEFRLGGSFKTLLPLRELEIRRKGKYYLEKKPIFPGYFFIQGVLCNELVLKIKKVKGVIRLLSSFVNPKKVVPNEMELILSLTKAGEYISSSAVFMEGQKAVIVSGPLTGFEGLIRKVDRRKKRLKIEMVFLGQKRLVDFGFTVCERKQ